MEFVTEQARSNLLLLVLRYLIKLAIAVQTTYNIERFHGATSHGGSKKFLFPVGAERKNRSNIKTLGLPQVLG